ncbi:MAG: Bax inhibitor-1/YccA family protein [Alphaproteobacteria bacterium]|nr:Bax inhibitor-1/YccA family protein [Alphaproteobacteria bacterium]
MAVDPRFNMTMERAASDAAVDAGLRSYMLRVYNLMALGVAFTGAVCLYVASNMALLQSLASAHLILFFAVLGAGFIIPKVIMTKSLAAAQGAFWVYAGLLALMVSPMVALYLNQSPMIVARAFFITAGMFAGVSLFGYTTKKDLSGWGRFLMMASIGLLIALVVNFFFGSSTIGLFLSVGVVLLMAAMTAYETQEIKSMYFAAESEDQAKRFAIMGALNLYGSFVIMFVHVLNILGVMNSDD